MKPISKRRIKRVERKQRDKDLLAMEREYDKLWEAKMALPPIKLDKPIWAGYQRHLVLRDDISRSPHGEALQQLLDYYKPTQHSKDGTFREYDYKFRRWKDMDWTWRPVGVQEFEDKGWSEKHRKYFKYRKEWWNFGYYSRYFDGYWFNVHEWYFEWKVSDWYHTHVFPIDPDIESKIKKIRDHLWGDWKNTGRLHKLHGWKGYTRDDWYDSAAGARADEATEYVLREMKNPEYAKDYNING